MKEKLPILPYGEGTFTYVAKHIRFRKTVNGKRVDVYGDTVRECMRKMKEKESESNYLEEIKTSTDVILQDAVSEWLYTFKMPELKPYSFDTLESTYKTHIRGTVIGKNWVSAITDTDLQKHLNKIAAVKSYSTTKKVYNLLRMFFNYKFARDLNANPMVTVKMPKRKDQETQITKEENNVLSDDEIKLLTKELSKPYVQGVGGYTHGYALLFIMWSFTRIGEALALQWKDVNFEEKTINIYKNYARVRDREHDGKYKWLVQTPKTKNGKRIEYVCDAALECLENYKQYAISLEPSSYIFRTQAGNPLSIQHMNHTLKSALNECGITKNISVHDLRHTGISFFIRHGVDVKVISEFAGHSDVGITNKIYYNVISEQRKGAYLNIEF